MNWRIFLGIIGTFDGRFASLGDTALEVARRTTTTDVAKRMHALLKNVPLGFHLHLMERDGAGSPTRATVAEAEEDADRLAYELLARVETIAATQDVRDGRRLTEALTGTYGLPELQARQYPAEFCCRPCKGSRSCCAAESSMSGVALDAWYGKGHHG